jgi:hypothetical protein
MIDEPAISLCINDFRRKIVQFLVNVFILYCIVQHLIDKDLSVLYKK